MTGKRFTMIYFETDGNLIFDENKHNGEWYNSAECLQDDEIVNWLNELHEEKERLNNTMKEVYDYFMDYLTEIIEDIDYDSYKELLLNINKLKKMENDIL